MKKVRENDESLNKGRDTFCLGEYVLEGRFRFRNKFGMTFLLLIAPFMAEDVGAQCVATQDCASLGYTEASCPNGGLKCPFGDTWSCKECDSKYKYTCTGSNESAGADSCGGKYSSCNCAKYYEWNSTSAKCEIKNVIPGECTGHAQNCSIGQILNTDGTCTADKENGKEPLGVVAAIKDNCGWAITASPIASEICWSTEQKLTGVFETTDTSTATTDFNVSSNMEKILQAGDASTYPAAYAAYNYAPSVAPETKGKWMLPTAGIVSSIYHNRDTVNNTISKIGGTQIKYPEVFWSSTEYYYGNIYVICSNEYGLCILGKGAIKPRDDKVTVRPVLEF